MNSGESTLHEEGHDVLVLDGVMNKNIKNTDKEGTLNEKDGKFFNRVLSKI